MGVQLGQRDRHTIQLSMACEGVPLEVSPSDYLFLRIGSASAAQMRAE